MASSMGSSDRDQIFRLLESAIRNGRGDEAAALAFMLAEVRVPCVIIDKSIEIIEVTVVVEKNGEHIKSLNVDALATDTLLDLKMKVQRDHEYPLNCQRWIINNILRKNDDVSLSVCGITASKKSDVFLNIIEPRTSVTNASTRKVVGDTPKSIQLNVQESNGVLRERKSQNKVKADRPPKKDQVMGWVCEACTFVNQPTRPGCEICSSPPPEDYLIPLDYVKSPAELERLRKEQENEKALQEAERKRKEEERRLADEAYERYKAFDKVNLIISDEQVSCPICLEDVEPGHGITLRECLHTFCVGCLQGTITNCEYAYIGCPAIDCPSVVLDREIKELVPMDVFQQYLQRSMNIAEGVIPNSYHCKTPDCRAWCIYEDQVNTFNCPACNAPNCLTCRAIHPNKSCKEYQDDLLVRSRTNEEAKKTQETIDEMIKNQEAMLCPGCQVVIMRKSGCGWICCTYCKTEICWMTKQARWGPKGVNDTSGGCRCRLNGLKCHPDCYSCH